MSASQNDQGFSIEQAASGFAGISQSLQNMVNNAELVILDNFAPQHNAYNQLATSAGPMGSW